MNPEKIFEKRLLSNPEVCNFCFRRKAYTDDVPEMAPDVVVPQFYLGGGSEIDYPPDRTDEMGMVVGSSTPTTNHNIRSEKGWMETEISRPSIVCLCGRLDDERIEGEFPDDWEYRPKEKLKEVSLRVYNRVEEEGFDIDYDIFVQSVNEYKTSDDYSADDYSILEDAVSDSVSVKPNA